MRPSSTVRPSVLFYVLLLSILAGCKVTGEDIEYWKGTVKGPGKIVAVMLSDRYSMELRTQAAVALVEMERQDVEGVAELQTALQTLKASDAVAAKEIVQSMIPDIEKLMVGSQSGPSKDEDRGPPPLQVRAKDAAYLLVQYADDAAKDRLIQAVVGWYAVDFSGRSLAGNYSVEQVVRSLGSRAASLLVGALNPRMPHQALIKVAEMIGQLGDDPTKERAAKRLVEIEREMEGAEYLKWLESKIRASLQEQSGSKAVNDDRVRAIASLNRENFINDGALPAMKHLASEEMVRERLLEIASTAPRGGLPAARVAQWNARRTKALQALEANATSRDLPKLLSLALDEKNDIAIRDYAFDRVSDIGSRAAIPKLWPLVQSSSAKKLKKRLRWRAGELVLAIGGPSVVREFFRKLPGGAGTEYEPEELEGYATKMSQMSPPPFDIVRAQLRATEWWNRVIALRFLERRGVERDVAFMRRLANDTTETAGEAWKPRNPPLDTVGKVAQSAIAALRERLAQPAKKDG